MASSDFRGLCLIVLENALNTHYISMLSFCFTANVWKKAQVSAFNNPSNCCLSIVLWFWPWDDALLCKSLLYKQHSNYTDKNMLEYGKQNLAAGTCEGCKQGTVLIPHHSEHCPLPNVWSSAKLTRTCCQRLKTSQIEQSRRKASEQLAMKTAFLASIQHSPLHRIHRDQERSRHSKAQRRHL